MKPGLLITFEGIEGCGKSTQLRLAAEWLTEKGIRFFCTREPGGSQIGSEIRKILLSQKTVALAPISEALLYMADRFQHIAEVITPRLAVGQLVLCDRYHDSTVAYQGYARNISLELLEQIWRQSGMSIDPDYTLLFDLDPETGIGRSMQKLQRLNLDESRFERETLEFHAKVRNGFLALSKLNPGRFEVLDASGSVEKVHQQTVSVLERRLRLKGYL